MFEKVNITGKNLVLLDDSVAARLSKLVSREVYFTVIGDDICLASSLEKIILLREESGNSVSICDVLARSYLLSGLVIPPFTIYKDIYRMPVYSQFTESNGSFKLKFDASFLDADPFYNEADIFENLRKIIKADLKKEEPSNIVCTLSGGADSAVLLSLLVADSPTEKIDALCCEMPGLKEEVDKAADIAKICDVNFVKYRPISINPATVIDDYAREYKNLVFDPVVPVISTMLLNYTKKNKLHENVRICLVEGQGADTILFGLPHAFTLAVYRLGLSPLFRILSRALPEPNDDIRGRSRTFYRIIKSIHLLSAKTWQESILHSLDLNQLKGTDYYSCYVEMIDHYFMVTKDRQKALVLFFLQVISTREMQKYQMLGKNIIPILPFLDQEFVARCLASRTDMFFRFPFRKIPIFRKVKILYGDIFKSRKTFPFVVEYGKNKISDELGLPEIQDDFSFRKYCLNVLSKN